MQSNREKLENLGIDLRRIKDEGKTLCPKCSHERKNKNEPCLSVAIEKGAFRCHNCDFKGFVTTSDDYTPQKQYDRPSLVNRTELSQDLADWFFGRGISPDTLIKFGVTQSREWMPQVGKERNTINFNYFRNGELINIKYRDGQKNFKLYKNAELILYNLDAIFDSKEALIAEGEIEAMTWHEAGYQYAVSVPNGASKGSARLEYIDNCIRYLEDKEKIYLAVDDDNAGHALRDELVRRLGAERCFLVDFAGFKDANELLVAKGSKSVLERLKMAREVPVSGLFGIRDFAGEIDQFWEFGLPEGIKSGDEEFDQKLRFMLGELTVITGVPSHGKSGFLEQLSIKLARNEGWRFGVFSPESFPASIYYSRMIKKLVGRPVSKYSMSKEEKDAAIDFLDDAFGFIKPDSLTIDSILEKARVLVVRRGIKGLIIDPWNRIDGASEMDGGAKVVEILGKIINFAQKHSVHVFLVAHPRKMQRIDPKDPSNSNFAVPTLYDISGSSHFYNMTQNGMCIYRDFDNNTTQVHIQKVKWEHLGELGVVEYVFDPKNTRFYHPGEDSSQNWTNGINVPRAQSSFEPTPHIEIKADNPSAGMAPSNELLF